MDYKESTLRFIKSNAKMDITYYSFILLYFKWTNIILRL